MPTPLFQDITVYARHSFTYSKPTNYGNRCQSADRSRHGHQPTGYGNGCHSADRSRHGHQPTGYGNGCQSADRSRHGHQPTGYGNGCQSAHRSRHDHQPTGYGNGCRQHIVQDTATNALAMETDASQHIVQDTATLNLLAKQRGFMVRDVAHDGNCLFTAIETQLPRFGIHCDGESLREQLVTYLEHHPFTHDGTCHLREFIAVPVVSTDPYSADTEAPND